MSGLADPQLVEVVCVWTGWGHRPSPFRDDARLEAHFGKAIAAQLLPKIRALQHEFYETDARFQSADLARMGRIAAEQFKQKHPDAADDIVQAFAWCYTYDFK